MANLRIRLDGKNIGREFRAATNRQRGRVLFAMQDAMKEVSRLILDEGRADIAAAGNFGSRWTEGLQVAEDFGPKQSRLEVFHTVPYWRVFEFGATIQGKPLLWIPLSFSDAVGTRARDYPGGLFRVDRKAGAPLLLSIQDREPKYFGKESVTIPKKFHLRDIIRAAASKIRDLFKAAFRSRG